MDHIIRHSYSASTDGQSVEALLRSQGYSKSLINRVKLTEDGLMIRGAKVYTTFRMKAGDRLDVTFAEEASSENIVPVHMPLSILYEDEDLMVINKAANVPIHPSQGNFSNSLANGLAWYFKQKQKPFVFRAINRLDRDTTGLLIVAKNALSSCILSDMVRNRQIHRTYLAAVSGNLSGQPEGTIDVPIARLPGSTIERIPDPVRGEAALTHYELLFYQPQTDTSLLKIRLETGRTHQIRVHMKHIGHPLYGDFLYNPDYRFLQRQSLHSWKLSFSHPVSGIPMEFTAPVPADMQQFLPDARKDACPTVIK